MHTTGSRDVGCGAFTYAISAKPQKKCFGLDVGKYASRRAIEDAVKSQLCKEDAVQKGKADGLSMCVWRTCSSNTLGALTVAIDFSENFSISYDDCVANLWGKCADPCDGKDGDKDGGG